MPDKPHVIISGFADEAANHKSAVEQLAAMAAIGLKYYTPRFVDVTGGGTVEHVVDLGKDKLDRLNALHAEYGMGVTSIGSRIGKVKLRDVDDGTHNKYIPIEQYIEKDVRQTINVAHALGTKLIRGFSFYHPRHDDPAKHYDQAAENLAKIVELCAKEDIIFGLEVEANLIGYDGQSLAALARRVNHPNMVLVFDGGNIAYQGYSPLDVFEEYRTMLPYLGWMHIKDYQRPAHKVKGGGPFDEDADWFFVPPNIGDAGHEYVFRDLRKELPALEQRLAKLGIPGLFLDMEPHVKSGGQFGGFSGPDGMGVAVRALCSLLDYCGIGYSLRTFDDVVASRGPVKIEAH